MKTLNAPEFSSLTHQATVLEEDGYGVKVMKLNDGSFLKLFRLKRTFSSALFYPYAKRFAANAAELQRLGVPTPRVIQCFSVAEPKRNCVHYHPLEGVTLRELYRREQQPMPDERVRLLGQFLASLHDKGVYFRSIHLGNIVLTPASDLGLIDLSDMKIQRRPLSNRLRLRNFAHLIKGEEDQASLQLAGEQGRLLLVSYLEGSQHSDKGLKEALTNALDIPL
ncbi:toluene tolerance protein [Aestuariirhabdus litorea]|uniref:Toluene tolerance protein n=1 Tax=Aestuariirhabdus litorea TaxID=2528527 RepID=A0A3P3VKT5_9GAMM|nr:toluene tolerance protein [Aestuariirhabdus litorea]RRJ82346.1 toluene tolerance protein [Aestuariirhabdus litorea]RWW92511.1 toluene tolerance protein [Endozoicomonadaceae bacterium GTF-13]